jgi:hypothetical protein
MGLKGEGSGTIAKAPPPEAFQLMLRYSCPRLSERVGYSVPGKIHPRCRDNIGVPGAVGNLDILYSVFSLCRLTEDMAFL